MRNILVPTLALGLMASLVGAERAGREMAETSFDSADTNGDGQIQRDEMLTMGAAIFASMDSDENNALDVDEFLSWGFGFENLAVERGKSPAYTAALLQVFNQWDGNADGLVRNGEHAQSIRAEFQNADTNNDGGLSNVEFFNEFSIMKAIGGVLRPASQ